VTTLNSGRAITLSAATWKKCTDKKGETVLVNVDVVAALRWGGAHTEVYFGNGEKTLRLKETPEFILNEAPVVKV
jgi:hypothetical protein